MDGSRFRRIGGRTVHDGHIFSVSVDTFHDDVTDETFERDVVNHPGAVAVAPVHDDGSLTLVRQYRPALGHDLLEIPAGIRDVAGEAPADTARRELAEEVGLTAERVTLLTTIHNAAGYADETIDIFAGHGLRTVATDAHSPAAQAVVIERHPLDAPEAMVVAGDITDVKTVVAILLLARGV